MYSQFCFPEHQRSRQNLRYVCLSHTELCWYAQIKENKWTDKKQIQPARMEQILLSMQLWHSGHAKQRTLGHCYGFASWTGQNDAQRHPKTGERFWWLVLTIWGEKEIDFLIVCFSVHCLLLHCKENRDFKKKEIQFCRSFLSRNTDRKPWSSLTGYICSSLAWNKGIYLAVTNPHLGFCSTMQANTLSMPFFPLFDYFHS